jgi:hypothetical protein
MAEHDMLGGETGQYAGPGIPRAVDLVDVDLGVEDAGGDYDANDAFTSPWDSDTSEIGSEVADTVGTSDAADAATDAPRRYENNDPDEPVPEVSEEAMRRGREIARNAASFAGVTMSDARIARTGAVLTGEWEFSAGVERRVEPRDPIELAPDVHGDDMPGGEDQVDFDEAVAVPAGLADTIRGILSLAGDATEMSGDGTAEALDAQVDEPVGAIADESQDTTSEERDLDGESGGTIDPPDTPTDGRTTFAEGGDDEPSGHDPANDVTIPGADETAEPDAYSADGAAGTQDAEPGVADGAEERLLKDRCYLPGEIRAGMQRANEALTGADKDMLALLAPRQREVAEALMAGDKTNAQIAEELGVVAPQVSKWGAQALMRIHQAEPEIVPYELVAPTGSSLYEERENAGANIDALRVSLGVTQAQVEAARGITKISQIRLHTGRSHPAPPVANEVLDYLVERGLDPKIAQAAAADYRTEYRAAMRAAVERRRATNERKRNTGG